jgi:hypothetical protein
MTTGRAPSSVRDRLATVARLDESRRPGDTTQRGDVAP